MEIYAVTIRLTEPMLGTVPYSKEVYAKFIETKKPAGTEGSETETVQEAEERGWTGFHKDEGGIFIYDYMIKGFLKNAGNVLKDTLKVKNLRAKINDHIFLFPRRLYPMPAKDKADGILERPLRCQTMQGPRVTVVRSDYLDTGTEFSFKVHVLKPEFAEYLQPRLDYGKYQGLGQWRNGSYGRFEVVGLIGVGEVV